MGINVDDHRAITQFAQSLQGFSRHLKGQLASIEGQSKQLGQKWKDEHYRQWAQQFDRSGQDIDRFVAASEEYCRYLFEAARTLEQAEQALRR